MAPAFLFLEKSRGLLTYSVDSIMFCWNINTFCFLDFSQIHLLKNGQPELFLLKPVLVCLIQRHDTTIKVPTARYRIPYIISNRNSNLVSGITHRLLVYISERLNHKRISFSLLDVTLNGSFSVNIAFHMFYELCSRQY